MSSGSYYYDPATNWQLDWANIDYYKKLFKTNCMARYIDRGFKKLAIDKMDMDLQLMDLYMEAKITEKINNKLYSETERLCNDLGQLKIDYEEMKKMLNE